MDELLTVLHVSESIAVSVLIWRSWVADKERREILKSMERTEEWIKGLVMELLKRTDLRNGGE